MKLKTEHYIKFIPYGLMFMVTEEPGLYWDYPYHRKVGFKFRFDIDETPRRVKHYEKPVFQVINERCKPILRPLSDINKKFVHDGISVLFRNSLSGFYDEFNDEALVILLRSEISQQTITMEIYNGLLKYNFDIGGLIELGLAVDINTIKKH